MDKAEPIMILGSLQTHAVRMPVEGGVCPTIGCTDFGLPRVIEVYNSIADEMYNSSANLEVEDERHGV